MEDMRRRKFDTMACQTMAHEKEKEAGGGPKADSAENVVNTRI